MRGQSKRGAIFGGEGIFSLSPESQCGGGKRISCLKEKTAGTHMPGEGVF